MALNIALYPELNSGYIERIGFQPSDYEFYYSDKNIKRKMAIDESYPGSPDHYIKDERWNPDDNEIIIHRELSLKFVDMLFGKNGITCKNSVLGIGVRWMSSQSYQRGVIEIGEIRLGDNNCEFVLEHSFDKGMLRGCVSFTTILYIKETGTPAFDEGHLANRYGCVLGVLDEKYNLFLDGNGSIFPLYYVDEPGRPLWYVKCDWEDPKYDRFSETIEVNINTANPDFKYLDPNRKNYNKQFLFEIISSSMMIIITKLKESPYWGDIDDLDKLQEGSVLQAVRYYRDTLGWDFNTPEGLSLSIRKYFDARVKENEN